jgi:hypothetical protein
MAHTQETTHYRIEWLMPNGEVRYNEAELYECMSAAIAAAEQIKADVLAPYARLSRRWLTLADYRIVTVLTRRTVQ